jgi:hypothetical protein
MNYQSIQLENYEKQLLRWPDEGRHILAQFDEESIIVYQAYRPAIGLFAVEHQYFGGEFSLNRMSWIKPNFLWMMYRSNWGQSPGQEIVLAIRLKRVFFDEVLKNAVPSSYDSQTYPTNHAWRTAVQSSDVRLQWDPDHDPAGNKCNRRAIQLGLRNEMLKQYSKRAIIEIIDVSDLIAEQRNNISSDINNLLTPKEDVYRVSEGN